MNYEEALKILEKRNVIYTDSKGGDAIRTAVKAVEKQIPKKPIAKPTKLFCPTCKKVYCSKIYSHEGFCKHCGQHITDWSDEE